MNPARATHHGSPNPSCRKPAAANGAFVPGGSAANPASPYRQPDTLSPSDDPFLDDDAPVATPISSSNNINRFSTVTAGEELYPDTPSGRNQGRRQRVTAPCRDGNPGSADQIAGSRRDGHVISEDCGGARGRGRGRGGLHADPRPVGPGGRHGARPTQQGRGKGEESGGPDRRVTDGSHGLSHGSNAGGAGGAGAGAGACHSRPHTHVPHSKAHPNTHSTTGSHSKDGGPKAGPSAGPKKPLTVRTSAGVVDVTGLTTFDLPSPTPLAAPLGAAASAGTASALDGGRNWRKFLRTTPARLLP
ncbi:hypothetical protein CLOM_g9172 [Closterium sp. NIES-68]|nr:hypothetical protein CLOM_g9172 [Closterium sp. NIES-68]